MQKYFIRESWITADQNRWFNLTGFCPQVLLWIRSSGSDTFVQLVQKEFD